MHIDRLGAAAQPHSGIEARARRRPGAAQHLRRDRRVAIERPRRLLQPRGHVHHVAEGGGHDMPAHADLAHHRAPAMGAQAEAQPPPQLLAKRRIEVAHPPRDPGSRRHRLRAGRIRADGEAEQRQQPVAGELVRLAPGRQHRIRHRLDEAAQREHRIVRRPAGSKCGRIAHVGEQGDDEALLGHMQRPPAGDELARQGGGDQRQDRDIAERHGLAGKSHRCRVGADACQQRALGGPRRRNGAGIREHPHPAGRAAAAATADRGVGHAQHAAGIEQRQAARQPHRSPVRVAHSDPSPPGLVPAPHPPRRQREREQPGVEDQEFVAQTEKPGRLRRSAFVRGSEVFGPPCRVRQVTRDFARALLEAEQRQHRHQHRAEQQIPPARARTSGAGRRRSAARCRHGSRRRSAPPPGSRPGSAAPPTSRAARSNRSCRRRRTASPRASPRRGWRAAPGSRGRARAARSPAAASRHSGARRATRRPGTDGSAARRTAAWCRSPPARSISAPAASPPSHRATNCPGCGRSGAS